MASAAPARSSVAPRAAGDRDAAAGDVLRERLQLRHRARARTPPHPRPPPQQAPPSTRPRRRRRPPPRAVPSRSRNTGSTASGCMRAGRVWRGVSVVHRRHSAAAGSTMPRRRRHPLDLRHARAAVGAGARRRADFRPPSTRRPPPPPRCGRGRPGSRRTRSAPRRPRRPAGRPAATRRSRRADHRPLEARLQPFQRRQRRRRPPCRARPPAAAVAHHGHAVLPRARVLVGELLARRQQRRAPQALQLAGVAASARNVANPAGMRARAQ